MNALMVLSPYKYEGKWVFDDASVGLVREPFVFGADTMIDRVVANIPDAEDGFVLLFSATPFPQFMAHLEWQREEYGGNWYLWREQEIEGWLCPALFKYFEAAPRDVYVRVEEKR